MEENLLENLRQSKGLVDEIFSLIFREVELDSEKEALSNLKDFRLFLNKNNPYFFAFLADVLFTMLLLFVVLFPFVGLLFVLFGVKNNAAVSWAPSLIVVGGVYPSYKIQRYFRKRCKLKINHKRILQIDEEINEIKNKIAAPIEMLGKISIVPQKYWYPLAIDSFIDYVECKRADSLKEAINLFESDKKHDAQMKQQEANAEQITKQISSFGSDVSSLKGSVDSLRWK
ncbi:MAG: hypothetical protein DDT19_02251 [Syntrophomonadaceae bacterium]|nr:hypothetical protein [Bacillota bacterium]